MEKVNEKIISSCKMCNKVYASKSSLCNHNKKFHKENVKIDAFLEIYGDKINVMYKNVKENVKKSEFSGENVKENVKIVKSLTCDLCNRTFNNRGTKSYHKKSCIINTNNGNKIEQLENQNRKYEEIINMFKEQFDNILKTKGKMHHKTLKKINTQLINSGIVNNGQFNNGTINNKTVNNTYIVKFGHLDYNDIFTESQIKQILARQYMSLEESVKRTHFNDKIPEFNNVFITNLKDDICYIFNGTQFISVKKNAMLNDLIDSHICEINASFEKNKETMTVKQTNILEKFLEMLNDDNKKFISGITNRTYPSYRAYKIDELKLLIYNESDKQKLDKLCKMNLKEKVYDLEL